MKIWFVTNEFPPNFGGGIGMYVDIVSRGMAEAGDDVIVITADKESKIERINDHLQYCRFSYDKTASEKMGYFITLCQAYYHQVMDLIDSYSAPDIIEVPEYGAIGYYILQGKYLGEKRLSGIKIVVHCHTPNFELSRINRASEYAFPMYWIGQMEKFCIGAADALLTQSHFLHDRLKVYAHNKRFEIISLPYPLAVKSKTPYLGGEYLLYAGRLEYRKGIWQFMKAMAQLWTEGNRTPCMLVGEDVAFEPTKKTIGTMIREKYGKWMDMGLLTMQGKVPPQKLEQLMAASKAVVVPSIYENYPYINIMAMANHVPVLVSRQGGQAEAVEQDGVNGFIFDWDKPGNCLAALRRLTALQDDELRRIGDNGYHRIYACCDMKRNIQIRRAFYQSLLDDSQPMTNYPFLSGMPYVALPEAVHETPEIPGMLSVIIPYYNLARTVEETIQSVTNSTYDAKMLEIILLDDGSTDPISIEKASEMARKYPVKLVRIANGGLANARNIGIHEAHGEYVCFLDADDTVEPSYFTRCVQVLKLHPNVSFVYSWVQYFEGSQDIWTTFDTTLPYLCAQNQLTCMAVARRKDYLAFAHNHVSMEYGLEDYDGWLGMVENGRMGVCIPEPLVNYRVRPESMARSMSYEAIIYLRSNLATLHPMLYQRFGAELYLMLMQNGSNIYWNSPLCENNRQNDLEKQMVALRAENEAIRNRQLYRIADRAANIILHNRFTHMIWAKWHSRAKDNDSH